MLAKKMLIEKNVRLKCFLPTKNCSQENCFSQKNGWPIFFLRQTNFVGQQIFFTKNPEFFWPPKVGVLQWHIQTHRQNQGPK